MLKYYVKVFMHGRRLNVILQYSINSLWCSGRELNIEQNLCACVVCTVQSRDYCPDFPSPIQSPQTSVIFVTTILAEYLIRLPHYYALTNAVVTYVSITLSMMCKTSVSPAKCSGCVRNSFYCSCLPHSSSPFQLPLSSRGNPNKN